MALQDLTPQLRTRLSRIERGVGWFVLIALGLMVFGFIYYLYTTAERRGWFLTKATYFTFVNSATGLKVGDPVRLMGFDAGSITKIEPMPGDQFIYNVFVEFELKAPNFEYIWTDGSQAKLASSDLLGKRALEVTKGTGGYPTYILNPLRSVSLAEAEMLENDPNWLWAQEFVASDGTLIVEAKKPVGNIKALRDAGFTNAWVMNVDPNEKSKRLTGIWNYRNGRYEPCTNNVSSYWLEIAESPAVTERLESLVTQIEDSLPGILNLTNQIGSVLQNTDTLLTNLSGVAGRATPLVDNLAAATEQLDRPGGLGEWLVPTNISHQLETTLGSASTTMGTATTTLDSVQTNLTVLVSNLGRTLDNLSDITSNLNNQVEANTNILTGVSEAITHADELVQGLKRHWLLRSAFKEKKPEAGGNFSPAPPPPVLRSPKQRSRR